PRTGRPRADSPRRHHPDAGHGCVLVAGGGDLRARARSLRFRQPVQHVWIGPAREALGREDRIDDKVKREATAVVRHVPVSARATATAASAEVMTGTTPKSTRSAHRAI